MPSRLDELLEAESTGRWRDNDRTTLRELAQLARQGRAAIDTPYDLDDPVSVAKMLANVVKLGEMIVALTPSDGDDVVMQKIARIANLPSAPLLVANGVGLGKSIVGLVRDIQREF